MASDIVAVGLKKFVGEDFCEFIWGDFDFNNEKVNQNVGSVYGIWMKASKKEIEDYESKYNKDMNEFEGYLSLYWGKDVKPSSRIDEHFKTSNGTGVINLVESEYKDRELVFGCVLTRQYKQREKDLHKAYPPIEGSSRGGKEPVKKNIFR